jgi:hypothetical protein
MSEGKRVVQAASSHGPRKQERRARARVELVHHHSSARSRVLLLSARLSVMSSALLRDAGDGKGRRRSTSVPTATARLQPWSQRRVRRGAVPAARPAFVGGLFVGGMKADAAA